MLLTALRFLLHDKAKSFGALFGVIMSIFLIGQQSGIFIFLTNAMAALVRNSGLTKAANVIQVKLSLCSRHQRKSRKIVCAVVTMYFDVVLRSTHVFCLPAISMRKRVQPYLL